MNCPVLLRPLQCLALMGTVSCSLSAQQINLSLHPTAVPDSFEVRATATSGLFTYLPNAVFTLRWELASGGVANNNDVRRPCGVFPVYNYGGTVDIGAYRYFTLVLNGERNMGDVCPIDTAGTVLCGVRIRELSACRHIALVDNAYTGMNNLDYYFAVGGVDVTGEITSAPIAEGDCSGCVPPEIQSVQVDTLPECGSGPVNFSVVATGTDLDYSWRSPMGTWIGYGPQGSLANGMPGQYMVEVSNGCGTATATAIAGFDPDLCDPALLDSAWFEMLPPAAAQMRLHSEGTGSCLSYEWVLPGGSSLTAGTTVSPISINANPGSYTFILHSACGSDTLVRELTPEMLCIPPVISLVASGAPAQLCNINPFALHVESSGNPAPMFEWTTPDGSLAATGDSAWLDPPQDGLYMVRAISICGVDTAFYPVQLDMAGLAACLPPVIEGFTSPFACQGDTILVQSQVDATGPCLSYHWSSPHSWQPTPDSPDILVYAVSSMPINLEVTNACGSASASYVPPNTPFDAPYLHLCGATEPVYLDLLYADYLSEGGVWLVNGQPVPGIYDPTVDASTTYTYRLTNGCDRIQVWVSDYPDHYAGKDTSILICQDADPVNLFSLLGGAEPGGDWSLGDDYFPFGIYDPELFGDSTRVFQYIAGVFSPCKDTAFVTVTETPGPFPWYADADGDGLGDPLDSLLSCDPLPGYVTMAGDACPFIPGTIGSPCDDGLAWTLNDTLDADCQCMGITTAVPEQDAAQWRLWPNPARDRVYLQAPPLGPVSVTVLDTHGRTVQRMERSLAGEPVSWPVAKLARGAYAVRILSPQTVRVLRLVVE